MNSSAFSFLANNSPEVDENQKMELTIGSLSFYVGHSGSTRLSDPAKSGPSASKIKTIAMFGSSVGSSSETHQSASQQQKILKRKSKNSIELEKNPT
jgi:hypothetical protein